jgi:DNA-binding NtrC family response regulator
MEAYSWPGNVRELENVVERTMTLSEGNTIEISDLPTDIGKADPGSQEAAFAGPKLTEQGIDMPQFVAGIERNLILSALALANGVKARAATLLSIKRTTLVEKIKRLKIEV